MEISLEGRTALVTGAASGIGAATAKIFGEAGASVVCVDVDPEGVRATAEELAAAGTVALPIVCDVRDPAAVGRCISEVLAWTGSLHVLANVAGIASFTHTTDLSLEEWDRVMAVNLTGPFLLIREAIPALAESRGSVVNVASLAGVVGWPYGAAYSASKGGLVMMTKALAIELAPRHIRLNCVCPGAVETPMVIDYPKVEGLERSIMKRTTGLEGRRADVREIASAILYLASDAASFVTGTELIVDGGASA